LGTATGDASVRTDSVAAISSGVWNWFIEVYR
jgi:hypothetical protein